jgi:hypothetical protein
MIGRKDFEAPGISAAREYFDWFELACASKTAALRHALATLGYTKVIYLDSDMYCLAPLTRVFEALEQRALLVTPHCLTPLDLEGGHTDDYDLLKVGHLNAGFLAVSTAAASLGLLDWLEARIVRYGFNSAAAGLFVDQKWVSALPHFFPNEVGVLADPGLNVGHWNAADRDLKLEGNTVWAGDAVLTLFHFSGWDPAAPGVMTSFQHRPAPPAAGPALSLVLERYARNLRAAADFPVDWTIDAVLPGKSPKEKLEAYKAAHGKNPAHYLMKEALTKQEALEQAKRDKEILSAYSELPAWLSWLVQRYLRKGHKREVNGG